MFKYLMEKIKENIRNKKLEAIQKSPKDRLELMKAGYKKFGSEMSERQRIKLKKEIKLLERSIKRWEQEAREGSRNAF